MSGRFITVHVYDTVAQALERIQNFHDDKEAAVNYVYVTGPSEVLLGVVPLRDLVFNPPTCPVARVMRSDIHFVKVTDDQEEVAQRIRQENLLALPVVDEGGRLVGVVTLADANRVSESEAGEDMRLMVGLPVEERIQTPWKKSIRNRLPWLCINMGTSMLAAVVVGFFETTIEKWTALVVFLPLISAVAGNAGIQGLTVVIRGLAHGDFTRQDGFQAVRKEVMIGVVNGIVLGVVIGAIALGWKGSLLLGLVAGAAMLLNQVIGALCGVLVPLGLRFFRVDPAMASSIFVTTFTDMAGFLVFLGLARMALRFLP